MTQVKKITVKLKKEKKDIKISRCLFNVDDQHLTIVSEDGNRGIIWKREEIERVEFTL